MTAAEPKADKLRTAVAFERGIWVSLVRWLRKRPVGAGPGVQTFSYAKAAAPIMWVFVVMSAVEIPILHLLIPSTTWRIVFLALGAWGVLWMLGLVASVHVHPHLMSVSGLRIRNSLTLDIPVPWSAVATVRQTRHTLPGTKSPVLEPGPDGDTLDVAVSSQVNVLITFRDPTPVHTSKLGTTPVVAIGCYADDPVALVAQARAHLAALAVD